ncbi:MULTISPECIES: hypothetical protein [Thermococcus]|uniref:Uncharacterized protein n=1 Tax=Thermococcus radiotolerans TaxID=187880 RepID=A0A2Z2N675_9EURY|nr:MULTISPECIES: hypothetical protein [Thermococcus]ASA78326.1 hypothetical protein CDI07_08465 [Thermococcus sp. 5-4]ASJ15062.1 hypothetical protein A3L10_07950 [Thermococcus radiotolerans]
MPAREMRMEMFLRALLRRDFTKAKAHLEKLQKMAGSDEWGRGYGKAINGFMSALKDNDTDALIVQLVNEHDREKAEKLLEHFQGILEHEFRDEYEKGYYTAWVEFLNAYLAQKTLALKK